jgi:hypothetical protein
MTMPQDIHNWFRPTPATPATSLGAIMPNDTTDLPAPTIALNVATPGVVRVTTITGETGDVMIAEGVAFPLRIVRVWETGTTATGITGLY